MWTTPEKRRKTCSTSANTENKEKRDGAMPSLLLSDAYFSTFFSVPMPSMVTSTVSPLLSQFFLSAG